MHGSHPNKQDARLADPSWGEGGGKGVEDLVFNPSSLDLDFLSTAPQHNISILTRGPPDIPPRRRDTVSFHIHPHFLCAPHRQRRAHQPAAKSKCRTSGSQASASPSLSVAPQQPHSLPPVDSRSGGWAAAKYFPSAETSDVHCGCHRTENKRGLYGVVGMLVRHLRDECISITPRHITSHSPHA